MATLAELAEHSAEVVFSLTSGVFFYILELIRKEFFLIAIVKLKSRHHCGVLLGFQTENGLISI